MASVTKIYNYYKKFDYKTQVMGASFRKVDQILEPRRLRPADDQPRPARKTEDRRRRGDAQADRRVGQGQRRRRSCTSTKRRSAGCTTKTRWRSTSSSDGIRKFYADARKLEKFALAKVAKAG